MSSRSEDSTIISPSEPTGHAVLGILLSLLAAAFTLALITAFFDFGPSARIGQNPANLLRTFGRFLAQVYGYCTVLIPLFLCIAAAESCRTGWRPRRGFILSISLIPFFTFVATEKLARLFLVRDTGPLLAVKCALTFVAAVLLVGIEYLLAVSLYDAKHRPDPAAVKALAVEPEDGDIESDAELDKIDELTAEADFDIVSKADIMKKQSLPPAAHAVAPTPPSSGETPPNFQEPPIPVSLEPVTGLAPDMVENREADLSDILIEDSEEFENMPPEDTPPEPSIPTVIETAVIEDKNDEKDTGEENTEFSTPISENTEEATVETAPPENVTVDSLEELEARLDAMLDELDAVPLVKAAEEGYLRFGENDGEKWDGKEYLVVPVLPTPKDSEEKDAVEAKKEAPEGSLHDKYVATLASLESAPPGEEYTEKVMPVRPGASSVHESAHGRAPTPTHLSDECSGPLVTREEIASLILPDDYGEDTDTEMLPDDSDPIEESFEVLSVPPAPAPLRSVARPLQGVYGVPVDLLQAYPDGEYWVIDDATRQAGEILQQTLSEFRIEAEVTGIRKGPVITMFEILPAPGVKLSRIVALQDNIALRLAASSVRIVAPIPGKHAVGIEVPNKRRSIVSFREIIGADHKEWDSMAIPVILGKDISGDAQIIDLAKTPHMLIAGATGAGKSVCVNSIILSILYKRSWHDVRMILIDPKIVELKLYNDIPHLLTPVITEPKRAFQALQYCLCEMERRYALLDGMGVRDITSYNRRIIEKHIAAEKLPYIVVIIDEFADLMATTGKELESTVARLAAMSRAVGVHLVLATQRPSIDVITGLIKANIPTRVAFMVSSKMDSRIIIDQVGADKLLGKGDMLYASATDPFPIRIQGTLVSDTEVENVAEYVKSMGEPDYIDDEIFYDDDSSTDDDDMDLIDAENDPMYEKAVEVVVQAGKASASYIQRRLKLGYNRAARLVEVMERRGIVGPANGSKARDLISVP